MVEARMRELGYELPPAMKAPYEFVSVQIIDNMAYISGTLPYVDGELPYIGKVGDTVTIEEAQKSAEYCILNALASLKEKIGTLDKVKQVVKVTGFVASASGFSQQAIVMNAATELLIKIFGEKGRHARSALGCAVMPRNTPVEIEMIVALES